MRLTEKIEKYKSRNLLYGLLWNMLQLHRNLSLKKERFKSKKFENRFYYFANRFLYEWDITIHSRLRNPRKLIAKQYYGVFGRKPNLDNPKTLNEKLQWLKLYDHRDFYTMCADKYEVRKYVEEKFGYEYLIPLLFNTTNWREVNGTNIKEFPCIIKANHSSKDFIIIKNSDNINWKKIQLKCRWWLHRDYYAESLEWQYKNIKRQIVVERLLQTSNGHIPNDYKLHFLNGELKFIYVSVDREGVNARNIYDPYWNPLYFQWNGRSKKAESRRGEEIDAPASLGKMIEFGKEIARDFKYVRVDYYDVDGKLYFGEITLQHGGGFDVFVPEHFDRYFGDMLSI